MLRRMYGYTRRNNIRNEVIHETVEMFSIENK